MAIRLDTSVLGRLSNQADVSHAVAVAAVAELAHAVTHLLTFNVLHFARLATFGPGVTVVDPRTV